MEKTLEQKIEELEKELEIDYDENSKRFNDASLNMDFRQFETYISETTERVSEISRKLRLIQFPTFNEISDYGDVMNLSDFINNVKSGGFIDYDGYGNYVKDNKQSDISIYPSDVKHGMVRTDFDTIIWFNR